MAEPVCRQSILSFWSVRYRYGLPSESTGKPGQSWHQDEAHIPTRDRSLTAAWIALDDATVHNGCLWVIPGSHRAGILHPVRAQRDERFDCTNEAWGFDERGAIPVELPAGAARSKRPRVSRPHGAMSRFPGAMFCFRGAAGRQPDVVG